MTGSMLGVSVTGLRVAQTALNTTGNNIANADVDGYSRQRVEAETNPSTFIGVGYEGNGANVSSIERVVNGFVVEQLRIDTSLYSDLDTFDKSISQLDRLLSDPATGLSTNLSSFFAAVQNGADDPTSIPARELIVSESQNLAQKFNTLYDRLDDIGDGADDIITSATANINSLVSNIARLNESIANAIGTGNGAQPNDLLDQRDETVRKLSELISIQTYSQGFGQINVVLSSGQNLVVGNDAYKLNVEVSAEDAKKLDIFIDNGENDIEVTDLISGGELGGALRFKESIMEETYNKLGRIAIVIADTFNRIHHQGIDLDNNFGRDFFYDVNDPDIANSRVVSNSNNAPPSDREISLTIVDSSVITADEYDLEIGAGGLFTIVNRTTDEQAATGVLTGVIPQTIQFDGFELSFDGGSYRAGDQYRIIPTRSGARDFSSEILGAQSIAFASPFSTDASIGNEGSGDISQGEVLSLEDQNGDMLPLFATPGQMSPPLIVRFTSDTTYDILDNSDPGNPVALDPPITNQRYIVGEENFLFSEDPGETLVQTNGDLIGLPVGRLPVIGGGTLTNGYPAEAITITRASSQAGVAPESTNLFTNINASARETASMLNNMEGITANASTYMEITDTQNLTRTDPLQININGEDLIEREFDSTLGAFVISSDVPDPATDPDGFNQYLADRINENPTFASSGIYAVAGVDATTGAFELRVMSSEGDDLQVSLEADATGPDSLSVSDGSNPSVALDGNGAGTTSAIAVGGTLDVRLADGYSLSTFPANSLLFGDTTDPDFARSNYMGIQASIQGTPRQGDTFTINLNVDGASDNRNALRLSDLQVSNTIGGDLTYYDGYSSIVEEIGIDTASTKTNLDASEEVLKESQARRDSISAVNLDEEASNLIRYEQMYSANAQVISVARDLFDRLINSF